MVTTKAQLEDQNRILTAARDDLLNQREKLAEELQQLKSAACPKSHPLPPSSRGYCAACELNKDHEKLQKARRYVEMAREMLQRAAAPKYKRRQRTVRSALDLLDMASEAIAPPLPPWLSSAMGGVIGLLGPMFGAMAVYLAMKRG